jgi:hypothetical protein
VIRGIRRKLAQTVRMSRIAWKGRQFRAADVFKHPEIVLHHAPQGIGCDAGVFVAKHVSDPGDFSPRNLRVPTLHLFRQMAARLGDDPQTSLDLLSFLAVGGERFQRGILQVRPDIENGIDNILQSRFRSRRDHQKTGTSDISMRPRKTGRKLRRVITSVLHPRIRAMTSWISMTPNRLNLPHSWSNNRSTSESGQASPRTVEPNKKRS